MLHLPTLRYYRTPLLYLGCVLPLCLQLSLTGWAAPLWQSPAPPPDADTYQSLVDRYNKLAPRTKQLWQQHRDREAYEGLRELLTLLQQIYPPAKYPDGHPHIVRCYRDLCLITDELGEYECSTNIAKKASSCVGNSFPEINAPTVAPCSPVCWSIWEMSSFVGASMLLQESHTSKQSLKTNYWKKAIMTFPM